MATRTPLNRMALGYPVGPVYLHAAPLFHLAGAMGVLWQFMAGGTHVAIASFAPLAFMETVQRERVTDSLLVTTMVQMVLDHPDFSAYDLTSLSFLVYGASPISESLLDRMTASFPRLLLMQGYGMTELAGCVSYLPPFYHTPEGRALGKLRDGGRTQSSVLVDQRLPLLVFGQMLERSPTTTSPITCAL